MLVKSQQTERQATVEGSRVTDRTERKWADVWIVRTQSKGRRDDMRYKETWHNKIDYCREI